MKDFQNKIEKESQHSTTTLNSSGNLSSTKRENAIFYVGIFSLLAIVILLFISQPIVNIKLAAASGIIFCISIMRLFELKQKK